MRFIILSFLCLSVSVVLVACNSPDSGGDAAPSGNGVPPRTGSNIYEGVYVFDQEAWVQFIQSELTGFKKDSQIVIGELQDGQTIVITDKVLEVVFRGSTDQLVLRCEIGEPTITPTKCVQDESVSGVGVYDLSGKIEAPAFDISIEGETLFLTLEYPEPYRKRS